ncbi:hypothetical protein HOY80DRAFT_1030120 [Tuber brumale]|nr:hypothetical protein HOY80DRAFT_1030120 [Tuber brumale]
MSIGLYPEREAEASFCRHPGFHGQRNELMELSRPPSPLVWLSLTLQGMGWGVYLKVYPKLKTRHNFSVVTEGFSRWLMQFGNPRKDVISLEHSMGEDLRSGSGVE